MVNQPFLYDSRKSKPHTTTSELELSLCFLRSTVVKNDEKIDIHFVDFNSFLFLLEIIFQIFFYKFQKVLRGLNILSVYLLIVTEGLGKQTHVGA